LSARNWLEVWALQVTLNEAQEAWVVIPMHFHGLKRLTASLDTTAVPGILTNSTDDPISAGNRDDYSFEPHVTSCARLA